MAVVVMVTIVRVISVAVAVPVVSIVGAIPSIMVALVAVAVVAGMVNAIGKCKARRHGEEQTDSFHLLDFQSGRKALPIRRVVI
ncbi:hypothetical protein GCM10011383_06610 [Hymenobacter cavernae]|uniref:Uncharacterized protein n=1 Tax=Hymenobacter cavernae TaxID=2044852 RepID=A0ABQ1TND2_9BACT|nr:hypothetical protein GCM10011383_06610 [Hymenobacter cavernae]